MGELYNRVCKHCKKAFKSETRKGYVCKECKKANKRKLDRERQKEQKTPTKERKRKFKTDISLFDMVKIIEAYNRTHGTKYTYGKFVSALERGEIELNTGERKEV